MENIERYNKDQLEEEGKVVRCKNPDCKSLNIKDDNLEGVAIEWCGDCGTTDYTEVIDLEEHLREVNG
jgi:hypothetical protein